MTTSIQPADCYRGRRGEIGPASIECRRGVAWYRIQPYHVARVLPSLDQPPRWGWGADRGHAPLRTAAAILLDATGGDAVKTRTLFKIFRRQVVGSFRDDRWQTSGDTVRLWVDVTWRRIQDHPRYASILQTLQSAQTATSEEVYRN